MLADIRIAARILRREPGHALVSILGLAVGLGFCLLMLGYARYCGSYNTHVPDVGQVYVLKHKRNWELDRQWSDQIPMALREPAKSLPGVADVTGYTNWFPLTVDMDGGLRKLRTLAALPGFTRMLGVQAVQGDLEAALARPDAIVLTEAAALRLFGSRQALGETVTLRLNAADVNVAKARVGAIVRTPPGNTTIPFECLIGLELSLLPDWAKSEALLGERGWQGGYLLVRLAPGASAAQVTAGLQAMAENSPLAAQVPDAIKAHAGEQKFTEIRLAPLREAYLDNEISRNPFTTDVPRGDRRTIAAMSAIGLLLLALAAVNYVNLATIRVIRRQREITLRKVLGTSRRRLALQFVAEALLVCLLATAMGVGLALLALPWFEGLLGRELSDVLNGGNLVLAVTLGVAVGLLSAIYPASVASRVRPARMLAGRGDGESAQGKRARQVLSVLQLALAIGLAGMTLAVAQQTRHAMTLSPGFDPAHKLVLELPIGMSAKWTPQATAFIAEALQNPAIAGIAVANTPVGENLGGWGNDLQRPGGEVVFMEVKVVSANFFELHGIAPVAGRLFRSSDGEEPQQWIVLNAEAVRRAGFLSPELAVGQVVKFRDHTQTMVDRTIAGIAPDIRFNSLREPVKPLMYLPLSVGSTLTAQARGSYAEAEQALHDLWSKHFPNAPFEPRAARDIYAANYADDARLAWVLALATLVAMLIAACGAYVLAVDAVRRRTREIALRKLFGARRAHIGGLVSGELGRLLLIAAAIALPVSGLFIARYLANFTEHTPMAYASLGVALLVAMLVVAIATARQAWLAMRMRPAAALRMG